MADSDKKIVRGKEIKKKFVRYKEGADLYSMSQSIKAAGRGCFFNINIKLMKE